MEPPTIEMGKDNEAGCDTMEQRQHSVITFEVREGEKCLEIDEVAIKNRDRGRENGQRET